MPASPSDWASDERQFRQRVLSVMLLGATGIGVVSIAIDAVALIVDGNWFLAGSGLAWTIEIALMAWLYRLSQQGREVEAARGFIASGIALIFIVAQLDTPSGVLVHLCIGAPFLVLSALGLLPRAEHDRWKLAVVIAFPAALILRQLLRPLAMFEDTGEFLGAVIGGDFGVYAMATLGQVMFDRLDRARSEALAAHLVKSRFLAVMSHELRTPLNAVIGYSELMREEVEAGELPSLQDVDRITDAGRRLLVMVGDILDFTTLEEAHHPLALEEVDLGAMGEGLARQGVALARENRNAFTAKLAPDLGQLRTDRARLERVLLALIGNACKFTDDGDVTFAVRATDREVEFAVSDSGEGMNAEDLGRLLQPFTQGDSAFTRTRGGIGIGLAIVDRNRKALGAALHIDTEPDVGTTVTLTVPRAASPQPAS